MTETINTNTAVSVDDIYTLAGIEKDNNPLAHIGVIVHDIRQYFAGFGYTLYFNKSRFEAMVIEAKDSGGKSNDRRVVVSHLLDKEETTAVVYVDNSKPVGSESKTRHYQSMRYLGFRNDVVEITSMINLPIEGDPSKVYLSKVQGYVLVWKEKGYEQVKDIDEAKALVKAKSKVSRSRVHSLMTTRQPMEEVAHHIFEYLKNGKYPEDFDQSKHEAFFKEFDKTGLQVVAGV